MASNDLWFTRTTRRYARIGDTMRVVTEGAIITVQLGDITRVSVVVTGPDVVVSKSTRMAATTAENIEPAAPKAKRTCRDCGETPCICAREPAAPKAPARKAPAKAPAAARKPRTRASA